MSAMLNELSFEEAMKKISEAVWLPDLKNLATSQLLMKFGKWEEATTYCGALLSSSDEIVRAQVPVLRGFIALGQRDFQEARRCFEERLAKAQDREALFGMAQVLLFTGGDPSRVLKLTEEARPKRSRLFASPRALTRFDLVRAWSYAKLGDRTKAKKIFTTALKYPLQQDHTQLTETVRAELEETPYR